jgi:hypothetical protein
MELTTPRKSRRPRLRVVGAEQGPVPHPYTTPRPVTSAGRFHARPVAIEVLPLDVT